MKDAGVGTDGGTALVLSEAQAAAVLSSVNAGEIAVAQAVLQQLTDTEVRGFAQQMISEHKGVQSEANNLMSQRGLVPEANPISEALETATEQLIAKLSSMSGRELEAAYVDSQVMMHQQALSLIDCVISPAVRDATLKVFVSERVRPAVTEHLQTAATLAASFGDVVPATPVDTGPSRCDLTCLPQGIGGSLPDSVRIVACPP